jgi:hypothetical protein
MFCVFAQESAKRVPGGAEIFPRFSNFLPRLFRRGKSGDKGFFAPFLLVNLQCGFGREAPSADARKNLLFHS